MLHRRNFIRTTGIAAAGALVLPNLSFKIDKGIGIQLYSLRNELPKDVKGVIGKIAGAGYKNVEMYGFSLKSGFWNHTPKEFRALLDSNGLKCPSGHYAVGTFLDTAGKDDYEVRAGIEAAAILGSKYYTIPWFDNGMAKTADGFKKASGLFNRIGELAKAQGLKAAYHNHNFEFVKFDGTTGYDIILKETDPNLVKMEADLYWIVRSGLDPVDVFRKNPGRFVMWHVKDMDKANKGLNTEVGNGSIDFKPVFAQQDLSGVETVFVEQENFTNIDPFVSIGKSYDFIKTKLL